MRFGSTQILFSVLRPFFLGGIGGVEFDPDYKDEQGRTPEKTTAYTLGVGIALDLARWLRLDVTARNYLFHDPNREGVEVPDVRHSNLLLTSGVTITLARRRTSASAEAVLFGALALGLNWGV